MFSKAIEDQQAPSRLDQSFRPGKADMIPATQRYIAAGIERVKYKLDIQVVSLWYSVFNVVICGIITT